MSQQNINVQGATTKPTKASLSDESGVSFTATYSPDDNKLRLYASRRLDKELYARVSAMGFKYAPKQKLFVARQWTPGREDFLIELAGEIVDEDKSLMARQEERSERFDIYSVKRAADSERALEAVEILTAKIPLGQPILVGHHSERHARRNALKVESGMRKAVQMFERAEYWEQRAQAAIQHALYKERPDVRYRRIKSLKADLRKTEKEIARCKKFIKLWSLGSIDMSLAKAIANQGNVSCCFPLDKYPRPPEKNQYEGRVNLWSALDDEIITPEQARDIAISAYQHSLNWNNRWSQHYRNRLAYETAMLGESGSVIAQGHQFEVGGKVLSRGEWLPILRINKRNGEISTLITPYYKFLGYEGTMKLTLDRVKDYQAPTAEEAATANVTAKRPPIINFNGGEGFLIMTKEEWSKKHRDYKTVKTFLASDNHGVYRQRWAMSTAYSLSPVYISDMKEIAIPR